MTVLQFDFTGRKVLIVEDDEHTRGLVRELCESSLFQTMTASTGDEAVESIEREVPDLVLLDVMLPGRDGFSVLKWMRESEKFRDIPVIVLSALADIEDKIRGMELGADDYMTKPFRLVELQTRIHSALTVREFRNRLQAAEDELTTFRATDTVTGSGTYAHLRTTLTAEISRSRRYGRPTALILFGIDETEGIRYRLGREGSDELLRRMLIQMRKVLRGADTDFRIDAEQFVVVLPETEIDGARVLAKRLQHTFSALCLEMNETLCCRFAAATFPSDNIRSAEDLLREANNNFKTLVTKNETIF